MGFLCWMCLVGKWKHENDEFGTKIPDFVLLMEAFTISDINTTGFDDQWSSNYLFNFIDPAFRFFLPAYWKY